MSVDYEELVEIIAWIDRHASGVELPVDERSLLASGCFDIALEHQAAIAILYSSSLYGSMMALLRVISESLVRGLWLLHCANDNEIERFKNGKIKKSFATLIEEFEYKIGTPDGVLSGFKATAWDAMNGFTHTGHIHVSRRHKPGRIEANFDSGDLSNALGVAGALGLIAGAQLAGMAQREDLAEKVLEKMNIYAKSSA